MALNIAVPLSGVGGLSPISPIGIDCWENIKILVSPMGSESSGVSSLDSEEAKQQLQPTPPKTPEELKISYNGRDILDLGANIEANSNKWNLRYTYLPENNNIPMFLANRSQYHRLGPNGHIQEYSLAKCNDCDFQYPINSSSNYFCQTSVNVSTTTNTAMTYTGIQNYQNHHHHHHHHYNNNNNINHKNYINQNHNNTIISDSFYNKNGISPKTITTNATTIPSMSAISAYPITNSKSNSKLSLTYSNMNNTNNNVSNKYQQQHQQQNGNNKQSFPNGFNNFYSFLNSFNNNNNNNNTNNGNYNNNASHVNGNLGAISTSSSSSSSSSSNAHQNFARMYKYF